MSRREEEFKHRTSIFEGAYRAWSHLGGLDPNLVRRKSAKELDPITFPNHGNDPRIKKANLHSDRPEYPYEPLPRSGLAHPYVQAILSPWLGPNADQEAVELGLATLRTWWQHRRKGENKSAIKILGTAKMREIVDTYTRHFFELAHCLVVVDQVQPPRSLQLVMKQSGMTTNVPRRSFGGGDEDDLSSGALGNSDVASQDTSVEGGDFLMNLSPLERVHLVQKNAMQLSSEDPVINIKGKCIPGKIDLPGIVDAVKRHANTLAHRGVMATTTVKSGGGGDTRRPAASKEAKETLYGDPNTMPIVFQTTKNANLIIMDVGGITCAHCVKIVETVLKGCQGGKSPIAGLLDAAADRAVSCVVVAIDHPSNAKRIAFESARNLKLVGYTALVKEVSVPASSDAAALDALYNSVVRMAKAYPFDNFQFSAPCSCPDSGVFRDNCQRHSQMDDRMFQAVAEHERAVRAYVDSTFSGLASQMDDDESSWIERPLLQQPVGSIVISVPPVRYAPTTGGCVDDVCNRLMIEQPMEFITHDSTLEVMREASQVEPIPYHHPGGHHAMPLPPGYWSNHAAARQSISALAVDWDTLEFGEEELGGRIDGDVDMGPSAQQQYPLESLGEEGMYHV